MNRKKSRETGNPSSFDVRGALAAALDHHRAARVDEAVALYNKVLEAEPDNFDALSRCGFLARQAGLDAFAETLLSRAVAIDPRFVAGLNVLGLICDDADRPNEAAGWYEKVLGVDPQILEALNNLGLAYRKLGRHDAAIGVFERALALEPDNVELAINLAATHREAADFEAAERLYRRVIAAAPELPAAHVELGIALQGKGDTEAALTAYDRALAIDGNNADAHHNRGIALLGLERHDEARDAFLEVTHIRYGGPWWGAKDFTAAEAAAPEPGPGPLHASTFKLTDRIDQIEYLIARGRIDPSFTEMASRLRRLRGEFERDHGPDGTVELTPEQRALVGRFHDRVVHFEDAPRLAGGAVNPALDFAALEESYFSSPLSITTLDDFLMPEALESLSRFCRESTVFFAYSGARFTGADLPGGFNCSLLYQMAEELKAHMPTLLGAHALTNIWAYRHRDQTVGVEAHTDQGAVTFNFWITPDEANLEPGRGGLVVYAREQPFDWDWQTINHNKYLPDVLKRIEDFLAEAETVTIPYACNRAVLFHSNLFHKSDGIRFKDGFENRRVNITMLFGKRENVQQKSA